MRTRIRSYLFGGPLHVYGAPRFERRATVRPHLPAECDGCPCHPWNYAGLANRLLARLRLYR